MYDRDLTHAEVLEAFREEVFKDGILHEGDTIGTDDRTLLCAGTPIQLTGHTLNGFAGVSCERGSSTWINPRK
jgi:hypothetical protein